MMSIVGLKDWIAKDGNDYIERAVRHASDLGTLSALRKNLRGQVLASPLFDGHAFAENWGNALQQMWLDYSSSNQADQ